MRYVVVNVRPTDYDPSEDEESLKALALDLNKDAIDAEAKERWIVVDEQTVEGLFQKTLAN